MLSSLHLTRWQIRLIIWHAAGSLAMLLDLITLASCWQSGQFLNLPWYAAAACRTCSGSTNRLPSHCTAQQSHDGSICPLMACHAMQVSIVSQEPILFAESIMHNIAYGTPGGSASVSLAMVRPWPALVSLLCVHCHIHCCNNGVRTACANELSCALTSELLGNLC